jgi:hypothetical protein
MYDKSVQQQKRIKLGKTQDKHVITPVDAAENFVIIGLNQISADPISV